MSLRASFLVAGVGLGVTLISPPSRACEYPITEALPGVLATESYELPTLPRNPAFVWTNEPLPTEDFVIAETASDQTPVLGNSVLGPFGNGRYLVRPTALLEANTSYRYYQYGSATQAFATGDYVDETPPEKPEILDGEITFHDNNQGCARSSCSDTTSLTFELVRLVSDDHARPDDMIYAVYLAESAAEANSMTTPTALLTSFSLHVDSAWNDRDAFITVSAFDHAGNESARSEPHRVNAALQEGCAVRTRSARTSVWLPLGALVALGLLRRARRRPIERR